MMILESVLILVGTITVIIAITYEIHKNKK
jgi:hypothetical protein